MADNLITTNITANADFSSLRAQLAATTAQLLKLQEVTAGTNAKLASQIAVMNKSFATTLTSTGQFSQHFVSLTSDVEKFGRNLDRGRLKLNDYFQTWQGHTRKTSNLVRDLAKQQVMMEQAIIQPIGKNAQGLMQYNIMVAKGLDEVKNKSALARQELAIMNKVMKDGAGQLINWGKNTQWAGRQLTVGLTVPLAAFGMAAQKAFREADQELVRLTKVYGGLSATSATELAKIRKDVSATAREIAGSYGIAFKDTIALAADLAATGQQGQALLEATKETSRLAILGEVDRQEAMKATLAIQNAFKSSTDELTQSIDFLNAVENQTSTSLADLVEAIPKAGPVVQSLGGDVKDLALYLTAMKEGGVNASEGANAIKSAMASLINPTKVAKEMFNGFGIDIDNIVTSNAGNLTATIVELQGALDNLDPLSKSRAIEQLFGKFQYARMSALFENLGKQGSQTLQVMELMGASAGELAGIAERELGMITESASGKFKRALASVQADLASVGNQFLTISTKVLEVVDGIIKFFQKLPQPLKTFLNLLGGITAFAGPIIMLAGVMGNFIGYIIKGIFHLRQLAKGGQGFKLLTPEIMAADAAGKGLAATFYSDTEATLILTNAVNTLASSFDTLELKANAAKVAVQPGISTVAGSVLAMGNPGQRVVDKNHPLVGKPFSRDMSHLIPSGDDQMGTIFGTVPGSKPVNIKVGRNPQAYMAGDLPKIPGLTSIGGVSTGIVAGEAAKWHAMTAAIAMQSEAELVLLKKEVMATGTVTSSLSDSYQALLPEFTEITSLAAQETAAIVAQVQQGKITVEAARAKIIQLNATVEAMLAETTRLTAAGMGRTASLSIVPLTSQSVVDPVTGKSNMKEMFHKGPTKEMVDRIARALAGVRTSGAGYNIETTKPKLNKGGYVPGTGNTDTYHTTAEPGSFVINKKSTEANRPLIDSILGGSPVFRNAGGQVPVVLTPGEAVIPAEIAQANIPLMYQLNGGPGNTSGMGKIRGGFPGTPKNLSLQRTHITEDLSGMALLLPRELNLGVNSNGKGLTGSYIASLIRATLASGMNPNSLMNEAAVTLGGDAVQAERRNSVALRELIRKLESPENASRMIGGKLDPFGFERLAKEIFKPALRGIKIDSSKAGGRRNLFSAISQVFTERAKEVLTRDEAIARGLITGKPTGSVQKGQIIKRRDGRLTWVSENRTIGSRVPAWARGTNLATLLTTSSGVSHALKIIARRKNAGGEIDDSLGLNVGGPVPGAPAQRLFGGGFSRRLFLGMPRSAKAVEAQRAAKIAMEKASEAAKNSRFAKEEPINYGELLSPTSGRSFPVAGIGGVYSRNGERVFVKPMLDEKAALAEMRATEIARDVHGLHAPKQRVVVMKDPTDPTGKRNLLALESKFDKTLAEQDGKFTTDQYFRQLVASALRGDKDLGRGNLSGNILADVGPAGVFGTASGLRDYSATMPSFKHQAMINLMGVKGSGAKKFFAESTADIPKGMTADQYHSRMLQEIEAALPKLKQTVSRFDLNAEEKVVYEAMIRRLSDARKQTYGDLHGIHSSIKISPEKTMTPAAIAKMTAADELKRRQMGHSVSLSDNAFKTPENGFVLGGFLGAITKGKAMHRIGAGFGKDSTGGWGVTSLEIGMAEKLFASTGLTKRTQRLFYDKFAAELAKEMPYGYAKNAQGQLLKALEPDIMDSVIRSSAGSVLSDPSGRKVLSAIDREILRKKFANWESKKDTPLTESLKRLIFNMEGREKGGPVNSGQPYIVGEKGPEIFVPRNAGGIIPNGAPMAQGYNAGGFIKMMLMQLLGGFGGQKLGAASGIPGGDFIGMMLGSMLAGGGMGFGGGAKVAATQKGILTRPMGQTMPAKSLPLIGVHQDEARKLTSAGLKMEQYAASTNKLKNIAAFAAKSLTRLNLGIGAVSLAVGIGINRYKAHQESMRLNALGYGMTAEAASKAGLKFTNFNDKIKEAVGHAEALRERNRLLYESMNGSGTPLNITIEEYKKLKKEVKDNYSDQILLINKTSADEQEALAIRLKEQLIAMGVSAEEASKKIYAMYAASKFAASAGAYTVGSKGEFNNIKDSASAAVSAIKNLNAAMEQGKDPTEQANQLNTAMMALSTDVEARTEALIKKRRAEATKKGEYFSTDDAKQAALDAELAAVTEINSQVKSQSVLTREVVDELAAIDPTIRKIVNEQETGLSLWQKTRIQLKGFTGDLRALSAAQTNDLYNLQISLGKAIATANSKGALKKQYEALEANKKLQAKYERDARGQKVKDQISDRDKMASLQKQIDLNNKLADARIKALTAAKEEGDIGREIAKKQAEYDAALATGDTAGAQQASLDMEGLQGQLQYNSQVKSIEESTARLNAPLIKQLEAMQKKQQDLADKAAIAGEKLGDLTKVIGDQESAIDAVNSAMLDYEIRLLSMAPAQREEWKKTKTAKEMIDAIGDAAKKAGVKLDGIKEQDLGKSIAEGIQKNLNAFSRVDVAGNVSIYVDGKKFNIGQIANGTKEDALDGGTVKSAVNAVNQNRSTLEVIKQQASIKAGLARENQTDIQWNGTVGPYSDRQIVKDYAKMMSYQEGTFFKLKNGDGSYSYFKVADAKGNILKIDAPAGKAMGGHINNYHHGGGVEGPGTGTSDSIPAYLSNGEYVIKEKAVRKYGVDTFDALNAEKFADGGVVPRYGVGGFIRSGFKKIPQIMGSAAIWQTMEEVEKFLSLKYGADKKDSGLEKWSKAFGRLAFNTAQGGLSGLTFGGAGGLAGVAAGLVEGLVGLAKDGSQYGVKGGSQSSIKGFDAKNALDNMSLLRSATNVAVNAGLSVPFGFAGNKLGPLFSKLTQKNTAIAKTKEAVKNRVSPKPNQALSQTEEQFQKMIDSIYTKESLNTENHALSMYNIDGKDFAFQGFKEDLSELAGTGINVVPTNPIGILEAALKISPKNKKIKKLLENFQNGNIKEDELTLLDQIIASVNISNDGSPAGYVDPDGFAMIVSSLAGNKNAEKIINAKTKAFLEAVGKNKAENSKNYSSDGKPSNYGIEAADPSTVPVIHSTKYPTVRDKDGNIILHPYGTHTIGKDDAVARASLHFTLEDAVKGHLMGSWDKTQKKIVTPLSSMIDANGLPYNMHSTDTWWMRNPGQPLVLKGSSVVNPYTDTLEYTKELIKRGLLKEGETPPLFSVDPKTKDVLHMYKDSYTDLDRKEIAERINEIGFEYIRKDDLDLLVGREDELIEILALQEAKSQVGIKPQPYKLESDGLSSGRRNDELLLLGQELSVRQGWHSQSAPESLEGYLNKSDKVGNTGSPQWSYVGNNDSIESLRMAAMHGGFKTGVGKLSRFIEEAKWREDGFAAGGYVKGKKINIPGYAGGAYVNPTYSPNMSVPSFDSGINSVPVDMLAMIHKNEAVVPANMNPFNPNANNATMGGATYNITNNINGYDGNLEQLSSMVTQKTITAIKSLDSRTASMSGPKMNVGINA